MFTLPPLPPKDYILKDVIQNQASSQEHTPVSAPRITQTNLAKFCSPIPYKENEKLASVDIDTTVSPQVLERWADNARAFWVDKPGKNAYFLHDIYKKYTVEVDPSYDSRYKHKEHVFTRSYKYEFDCMEAQRLHKLYKKMEREECEEKEKQRIIDEKNRVVANLGVKSCEVEPPFWIKTEKSQENPIVIQGNLESQSKTEQLKRWQEDPNPWKAMNATPCQRRDDLTLIGLPFRSECCNWYYQNYPPPNLPFIPKRFT